MRRHHRALGIVAPLLALALTATACAGGSEGEGNNTTPQEIKAVDMNAMPRDKVKEGGTLRWGLNEFMAQYNRLHNEGNNANLRNMDSALLPLPFVADEKANITPNPDYIADFKEETEPKQVVTLSLNRSAKWSDGKPITWKDYESQWKAMNGSNSDFVIRGSEGWDRIESIEQGKDEFEVVITFAENYADWEGLYDPLMPAEYTATPEKFNEGYREGWPVTAGPFKFDSIDKTAKTVTISRDPNWWGDPAKLDKIIFRSMDDKALTGAFANDEIDYFDVGPSPSAVKQLKGKQGTELRTAGNPDFRHVTMNGESEFLSDVRVRNAMFMAINREAIAKSDLQGLDWPAVPLNNHFYMNSQKGYQDNAGELGKYNPERAKQLLDQAGWKLPQGKKVREKNGKPMDLSFVVPTGVPVSQQEGELIQTMLQEVGVKVTIEAVPSDDFFDRKIIPGDYDMTPFSWIGDPFPIAGSDQYRDSPKKDGKKVWGTNNLARVGSPEVDEAMDKALAELDPAKAVKLAQEADKLIWQLGNTLPLYQRPKIAAVRSNIANLGAEGFKSLRYEDIGFTS